MLPAQKKRKTSHDMILLLDVERLNYHTLSCWLILYDSISLNNPAWHKEWSEISV